MGKVIAVCTSEKKGTAKVNVGRVNIIENFGLEGDAHGGDWHRQVSLLPLEKIEAFKAEGAKVEDGSFGENIITEGIALKELPVGTKLRSGSILLEVTQIGKKCHTSCAIGETMGKCIMPTEGIFAKVLAGGVLEVGDGIEIVDAIEVSGENKTEDK